MKLRSYIYSIICDFVVRREQEAANKYNYYVGILEEFSEPESDGKKFDMFRPR